MPVTSFQSSIAHGLRGDGLIARDANSHIVDQLRAYYSSIEGQEVPRHLLELLRRLDEAEDAAGKEARG